MASSFSLERRMLKDFLDDELPSCSSNDLKSSHPRKPCKLRARSLSTSNKTPSQRLIRSRSKAASISISAVHRASDIVINAIKSLPFGAMKTPAILPRSISRMLSRRNKEDRNNAVIDAVSVKVKIKDILRWKSFRDVAMELEEMPLPASLEFSCSPNLRTTTTSITTGSSRTGSTSSKRSSWCESDFTVEDSSSCCSEDKDCMNGNGAAEFDKHPLRECVEGTKIATASKRELRFDEEDQQSPVSVLDSPFREDKEFFHRSLAAVERSKCRLMQRIQEFESLTKLEPIKNLERDHFPTEEDNYCFFGEDEETKNDAMHKKARQLLSHVKGKRSGKNVEAAKSDYDHLLLDFFIHELAIGSKLEQNEAKFDGQMLRLAESWLNKGCNGSLDWEMLGNREDCIRDMEKGLRWNSFEEEQREFGFKLEIEVLNDLFDEILVDLDLDH